MKDFCQLVLVVLPPENASRPNSARAFSASSAERAAAVIGRFNFPPNDGWNSARQRHWRSYNQDEGMVAFRLLPLRPLPQMPGNQRDGNIDEKAGDERPVFPQ